VNLPNTKNPVAYLCAEFGTDSNLPTYAGGLGILAGDTLLEAAEQNFPMLGIGLLYQGRKFLQEFTPDGWQVEDASPFQAENTSLVRPVEIKGKRLILNLNFNNEPVKVIAYRQRIGPSVSLYLLSTDFDGNSEAWRDIMQAEYAGGDETQLKQQLILGIAGLRLLETLGIKPSLYHFQEGRPIFAHWELTRRQMVKNKISFPEASKAATEKIVYTNHTLVPDGNLVYNTNLLRPYAESFARDCGCGCQDLLAPGLTKNGNFSITKYGLETSKVASAVSRLHGKLCKKLWPEYAWQVVTNGIFLPRWQDVAFKNPGLSDHQLWDLHLSKKRDLAHVVKRRSGFSYDPDCLVVGWARRISGYKQVEKLFQDPDRLLKIVAASSRPVQILIAGKAHPGDDIGKKCIQDMMKTMADHLSNHALFIPNYDIALASYMISGVDLWLNTPEYSKEACGTSGMKALSNGVLNCSVADGWVAEFNLSEVGWVIDHTNLSQSLYGLLENEIVPMFYSRDSELLPREWIIRMRSSIALSRRFSTEKMLEGYIKKLYSQALSTT
jgi:starch phosphorylase